MDLCIVIPAFNEEHAIARTVREYKEVFPEGRVVVVDNNSKDATAQAARDALDPDTDLILFEPRQGKGLAIRRGLSRLSADVYIMTDGDATYPAEDAKKLLDMLVKLRADMLVGDRVSGGAYDKQNSRRGHGLGNKVLTRVISSLAGQRYSDVLSGLRVMSSHFVAALDVRSTGFQLETEMNVVAAYLRADVVEHPISYRERPEDSHSKLNTLRDGFRILYFASTNWIAFSPMRAFTLFGALALLVAGGLAYRVIAGFMEHGWPYTTTAVAAGAAALAGILALFTGITLHILVRNDRRRVISRFLGAKRAWNTKLDGERI
jgi:glycosyltransferase involved in cell wall biosynthesis